MLLDKKVVFETQRLTIRLATVDDAEISLNLLICHIRVKALPTLVLP